MAPDRTLTAVPVQSGPTFVSGTPQPLFTPEDRYILDNVGRSYDAARDGERFLMLKRGKIANAATSQRINVVLNWFEELEERVPVP